MGLVYLPTFGSKMYGKCRLIYQSPWGSYGLYTSPKPLNFIDTFDNSAGLELAHGEHAYQARLRCVFFYKSLPGAEGMGRKMFEKKATKHDYLFWRVDLQK